MFENEKAVSRAEDEAFAHVAVRTCADVSEKAIGTLFATIEDVRGHVNQAVVVGTIDWIDGTQQSLIKMARTIDGRFDALSKEALQAAESLAKRLVQVGRGTGYAVADATSHVARALVGSNGATKPAPTAPIAEA
jgi:hypothetical protein